VSKTSRVFSVISGLDIAATLRLSAWVFSLPLVDSGRAGFAMAFSRWTHRVYAPPMHFLQGCPVTGLVAIALCGLRVDHVGRRLKDAGTGSSERE